MENFEYIKRNLNSLKEELADAAKSAGCVTPKLVAVTKSATDSELAYLLSIGQSAIGENRPQELLRRGELLRTLGYSPELHEIGNLQSNKAKIVCPVSTLIHSLDSESLAKEINRTAEKLNKKVDVLIEINSGREPQKGGIMPELAETFAAGLSRYPNIRLRGLMTMGPNLSDPEDLRRYFSLTKELFEKLRYTYSSDGDPILSMGMSESFRVAAEEGSTLVRVGRRLFIKDQQ